MEYDVYNRESLLSKNFFINVNSIILYFYLSNRFYWKLIYKVFTFTKQFSNSKKDFFYLKRFVLLEYFKKIKIVF
jgi:hypothetical protein